ncbi:MAG: NAD(P)-dependent alcohol dehydrogenase [Deltaproteobacteria bacterium]|nr:NAD(P)-dependent alcohol dehydrogenase [Deltaproteobacteria bacterium]
MPETKAYATKRADADLEPFTLARREPRKNDVVIDIQFCGVCHSDIHTAKNEWGNTTYPCVPGHEIVGRVASVGPAVTKVKAGDLVGVGCLVASCGACTQCKDGFEMYCERGCTFTYNSEDRAGGGGPVSYGGYAERVVVEEAFVLRMDAKLDPAAAAPLLCAGITTYSPLRHWKIGKGHRVGIVGLGGLGHMGVKLAKAFGAEVTLFTTSASKVEDGKRLGADEVVISKDAAAMAKQAGRFDFVLDTVSADHDINALLSTLRRDGTLCLVGAPEKPIPVSAFGVIFGRKSFAGSLIGGVAETQEMLDFCASKNITADVEVIPIQKINEAYARMLKSDVKYRFVIDLASLKQ